MAIINAVGIGKAKGSMGNITYKTRQGQTVGSQKVSKGQQKVGTYRQVARRVILSNMVTAYQRFNAIGDGAGMHHSFPLRERGNDFNGFVAENMAKATVAAIATPKNLGNVLIPAPFIMSRGNLAKPEVLQATFAAGAFTVPGTNNFPNMGALSVALTSLGFQDGDTVTFVSLNWSDNTMISAKVMGFQIIVDTTSTEALPSFITAQGVITVGNPTNSDAVIIRGRKGESGWDVSDAEFSDETMNSASYIAYTGLPAKANAVESWGYRAEPYLQAGANPQ